MVLEREGFLVAGVQADRLLPVGVFAGEIIGGNAIIIEKYDSVTHEALPGCTFQLRYLGGTSGTGGTVIGQKVTGKNGTAIWTGLQPGTYVLEEVDPADGYSIIQESESRPPGWRVP